MHETIWNLGSIGNKAPARHRIPACRNDLSASSRQNQSFLKLRCALAAGAQEIRKERRAKTEACSRSPRPAVSKTEAAALKSPVTEPLALRILHGCLDIEQGTSANRFKIRRSLYSGERLADIDQPRLELPKAGKARQRTGRKSNRKMEAIQLASYKKTPKDLVPTWSFLTKAVSFLFQIWSGHGHPKDRRRSCAVREVGERFPQYLQSAFPHNAAGWRFMQDSIAERTLSLPRWSDFLSTFSNISVAMCSFFGILPHRGKLVRRLLDGHPRLHTYRFPGYAPELNPDEGIWRHLKRAVANSAPEDLRHLKRLIHPPLQRVRQSQKLLWGCILASDLPWP